MTTEMIENRLLAYDTKDIIDWVWTHVIPEGLPLADELGVGADYREMLSGRTPAACEVARVAVHRAPTKAGSLEEAGRLDCLEMLAEKAALMTAGTRALDWLPARLGRSGVARNGDRPDVWMAAELARLAVAVRSGQCADMSYAEKLLAQLPGGR